MNFLIFIVLIFSSFTASSNIQMVENYIRISIDYNHLILIGRVLSKTGESINYIFYWVSPEAIGNGIIAAIIFAMLCMITKKIKKYFYRKKPSQKLSEKPPVTNNFYNCHFEYKGCDRDCKKRKTKEHFISNATKISEVPQPQDKYIIVIYKMNDDIKVG